MGISLLALNTLEVFRNSPMSIPMQKGWSDPSSMNFNALQGRYYPKEVKKSNFRQSAHIKNRDGKRQRRKSEEKGRRKKTLVAPEGQKAASLKRRVRSHLAR